MQPAELRALLAELEIAQEDFGRALGVGHKTVQRWVAEGGSVPGPVAIIAALIKRHPQLLVELGIGRKSARGRPLLLPRTSHRPTRSKGKPRGRADT